MRDDLLGLFDGRCDSASMVIWLLLRVSCKPIVVERHPRSDNRESTDLTRLVRVLGHSITSCYYLMLGRAVVLVVYHFFSIPLLVRISPANIEDGPGSVSQTGKARKKLQVVPSICQTVAGSGKLLAFLSHFSTVLASFATITTVSWHGRAPRGDWRQDVAISSFRSSRTLLGGPLHDDCVGGLRGVVDWGLADDG